MRRLATWVLLLLLVVAHLLALGKADAARKALPREAGGRYLLPSPILKIAALEFDGLAADFLFLEAISFYGSTFEREGERRIEKWEWLWLNNLLETATDLDPYFYDPYYFGNAVLTQEQGMVRDVNALLEKGSRYRDWDWTLPFYVGFNNFYFLQNNVQAAEWLMEGARRPEASPLLSTLAARLAYQGKRTENAILFLQEILKGTEDEETREIYQTRLEALKRIYFLEQAVSYFRNEFGRLPSTLTVLVERGVIGQIPEDPYGGTFYLAEDGSIATTSDLTHRRGAEKN